MGGRDLIPLLPSKSTTINPPTIMEDFISMIPPGFLPKQLVQDIKDGENVRIDPQQLHDFLLLLAMFLNDFCNATAQFTYGVDDLLDGGDCSDQEKNTLLHRKEQLTRVNDYIQTFCSIIHTKKLLNPKIILHVIQKYIPEGLMTATGDHTTDVARVLDTLQDHLLNAVPETQKHSNARLSDLWIQFNKESGSLIEEEVVHGLWKSLYRTIHYAHSIGGVEAVQEDKTGEGQSLPIESLMVDESPMQSDQAGQGQGHPTAAELSAQCDEATEDIPITVGTR